MSPTVSQLPHPDAAAVSTVATGPLLDGPVLLPRVRDAGQRAGSDGAEELSAHLDRLGERPAGSRQLIELVERSGLTGQGGAHAPTAARWRRAMSRAGGVRVVVANGAESEPLSGKDTVLLRRRPHLVLDGLELVAEAVGARRAVVWLHDEDQATRRAVGAALRQRQSATVGPSRFRRVELAGAPAHYLAGERSAIGRALAGGPPLPVGRPAPGRSRPDDGMLVHNVDTLARVALVARGIPATSTRLVTVLTPSSRVVLEASLERTLGQVVAAAGWRALPGEPQAVLLGGFGGQWMPWQQVAELSVAEPQLRRAGVSAGPGIVAPLPAGVCGVAETAVIAGYLAAMSAGQCGPCAFGLPALSAHLGRLARGEIGPRRLRRLGTDLGLVAGRGGCHHPDGAVRVIESALTTFAADVHAHRSGHACLPRRGYLPVPQVPAPAFDAGFEGRW